MWHIITSPLTRDFTQQPQQQGSITAFTLKNGHANHAI